MHTWDDLSRGEPACYTGGMEHENPKLVRRELLSILYESFLDDPLQMLSPSDITDKGSIKTRDLIASAHYLHERDYIEMMVGYNPPMFAATRIAPLGIDLYEDDDAFNRMFPLGPRKHSEYAAVVIPLMLTLAEEAEVASLDGERKEWLLNDIRHLRELLCRPEEKWPATEILSRLQWLDGFFMPEENAPLPSLEELKTVLHERLL